MKIGIVGLGVVGNACKEGFLSGGHEIKGHDIVLNTSLSDLSDCEIVYLTVPTPSKEDGSCNTNIVESVVSELENIDYQGLVAVKSTVPPGTTDMLQNKYHKLQICFVPEFLKERSASEDFINHGTLIVGAYTELQARLVYDSHSHLTDDWRYVTPAEAESIKYFHNVFNAVRITFGNEMFDVCNAVNASYEKVLEGAISRNSYGTEYLKVTEHLRGYAGVCLPKDVNALIKFCESNDIPGQLIRATSVSNADRRKTVIGNMRIN